MTGVVLCVFAFAITLWAGRRSVGLGLLVTIGIGYVYGIVRANVPQALAYFMFDASLLGLYVAQFVLGQRLGSDQNSSAIRYWTLILIIWPCLLVVLPFQPLIVSIVGLRGNVFFLPILLLGSRLRKGDLLTVSCGLAILNLVALSFAIGEFVLGVDRFFPPTPASRLVLQSFGSTGLGGAMYVRIPSTFGGSHAYAGAMVTSLPFLFGLWNQRRIGRFVKSLSLAAIVAALIGVLMAASRSHFGIAAGLVAVALFTGRMRWQQRLLFVGVIAAVGVVSLSNERLQRFMELGDADQVQERIEGSVNRKFFEILSSYPVGNGLGSGGTSLPYFLQVRLKKPVHMENEYARILLEQGIVGLLLWCGFIFWFVANRVAFSKCSWLAGRRLAWFSCTAYFGTGMIGIGLLTSIPQTVLFLSAIGWISVREWPELVAEVPSPGGRFSSRLPAKQYAH